MPWNNASHGLNKSLITETAPVLVSHLLCIFSLLESGHIFGIGIQWSSKAGSPLSALRKYFLLSLVTFGVEGRSPGPYMLRYLGSRTVVFSLGCPQT